MKIVDEKTIRFKYSSKTVRDTDGHGHPGPEHEAVQSLLKIKTDEGVEGYSFGGNAQVVANTIKPALVGEDPLYREGIWQDLKERQRLNLGTLSDGILCTVDLALWDLAGRSVDQPVHKLLGAFRDKVPAYASTMCGDELEDGLDTQEAYAEFALACKARGYPAFKLHTWQPPVSWAPDPKKDVAACRAVREAVGDEMDLMLDPFHYYSREESLYIGKALEELGYYWIEEPMDEHSISSYVWLTEQLSIPVVGPETAEGKMYTRAEWIRMNASDISRGGVRDLGGITPIVKTAHLCESFGVRMEVHGGGPGNLHVLCTMGFPGQYYERGLLHPFIDYDATPAWLNELPDQWMMRDLSTCSEKPGLGLDINFDYINSNLVD